MILACREFGRAVAGLHRSRISNRNAVAAFSLVAANVSWLTPLWGRLERTHIRCYKDKQATISALKSFGGT